MTLSLRHRTTFIYAGQARDSFNEVRLRPVDDGLQACRQFNLSITPEVPVRDYVDFHGNTVHFFDVTQGHTRLTVDAVSEVETMPDADRKPVPIVPFADLLASTEREMFAEFYTDSHYVPLAPELWREAQDGLANEPTDVWNDVRRLGRKVHRLLSYRPRATGVNTLATDALRMRAGVCQDFAHVMLGMCRCVGIPARYVSGYFLQLHRKPGESEASHAWVEAFVPGFGWTAYDPTHDRPAGDRYIKVATGRDYADIRPVCGTYRGAPTRELRVEVSVQPLVPSGTGS